MTEEKMCRMANQIARFFASKPEDEAAVGIAKHISEFWEPRMRSQLLEHAARGGAGLDPLVIAALPSIRVPATA